MTMYIFFCWYGRLHIRKFVCNWFDCLKKGKKKSPPLDRLDSHLVRDASLRGRVAQGPHIKR